MYSLKDRIYGSLLTAAVGDALGAPAEGFSRAEIAEKFGRIETFESCAGHPISPDNRIGEITDDTSQMLEMAKAVAKAGKDFSVQDGADALVSWAHNYPKYYPRNAGPTTQHTIQALMEGADPLTVGKSGHVYGRGTSNGAVMRIAAAGLIHPGDYDGAIKTAIAMTAPSHCTQHAYSAACAVSCAISEALTENASVWSVLQAALYGAKQGEEIGMKEARIASGIYTYPLIIKAISCVLESETLEAAEDAMERRINSADIGAQSAAAVAIALFSAANGDPLKTIISCANSGGDTDTVACIAGMIAGAYSGSSALPSDLLDIFHRANPDLDLKSTADALSELVCR